MASSSSTMPPPPSPLAHRRTRPHSNINPSSCSQRRTSLPKAATFHQHSSPASEDDPVLSLPHLTRRSPTCSRATLANWVSEKREAAAQYIADFEQTFSGARGSRPATRRRSAEEFEQRLKHHRPASLLDSGLGSSIGSPSDKGLAKTLERALDFVTDKDSALGGSVVESVEGAVDRSPYVTEPVGVDAELIKVADNPDTTTPPVRQSGKRKTSSNTATSTLARTPSSSSSVSSSSVLSSFARKAIAESLLKPLIREERFKDFRRIVRSIGRNSNNHCLRDIERSLLFQPLTLSVSSSLYRAYGELTVQLVADTVPQVSESEQRRSSDRPYDNGYFLDLVQQVSRLAAQIGTSNQAADEGDDVEEDLPSIDDEITLEGGLGETGNLAELVRWKNGKGISLRTGLPYEGMPGVKRGSSTMLDEDAERSMARRKKGYIPEIVDMPCREPDCDKVFNRKCDLSKHEKTHSRPYKCPFKTCKYHDHGLPTEKEKDRHVNDKHASNPKMFTCHYCEFKTKRESNCKQHMEKKHQWTYRRAKGKDREADGTPDGTPASVLMSRDASFQSFQSPTGSAMHWEQVGYPGGSMPESGLSSVQHTPYEDSLSYDTTLGMNQGSSGALFPRNPPVTAFDFNSPLPMNNNGMLIYNHSNNYISPPETTPESSLQMKMTPQTPAFSTITSHGPSPMLHPPETNWNNPGYFNHGFPTPDSVHQHSRQHSFVDAALTAPMFDPVAATAGQFNSMEMNTNEVFEDYPLPGEDFTMFTGAGAFTNPQAADATLFQAPDQYQPPDDFTNEMFSFDDLGDVTTFNPDFDKFLNMDQA